MVSWPKTKRAEYYRLFADRMLELVTPTSPSAYRVHALSTPSKFKELGVNANKVLERSIPKVTLDPIISEVNEAIQVDPVVKEALREKSLQPETLIVLNTQTTEDIFHRVQTFISLVGKGYKDKCEQLIISECNENGSKSKLLILAKLYVAELISLGFHREYISYAVRKVFHTRDISKCTPGLIRNLFRFFLTDKKRDFTLLYAASLDSSSYISKTLSLRESGAIKDLDTRLQPHAEKYFSGHEGCYITIPDNPSLDPFSAVGSIEKYLALPGAFLSLFPFEISHNIENKCLVHTKDVKEVFQVDRSKINSPISERFLSKEESEKFSRGCMLLLGRLLMENPSDGHRLLRSLNAVGLARNTKDTESQVVTLWSAFEALLPEPTKDEKSTARIVHFCDLVLPSLTRKFFVKKLTAFDFVLEERFGEKYNHFMVEEFGDRSKEKNLFDLFYSTESIKQKFCNLISDSPLFLHRAYELEKLFTNPGTMLKKFDTHNARVKSHLHRIYRERNDIVHSGDRSSFCGSLAENALSYYTTVLKDLMSCFEQHGVMNIYSSLQVINSIQKNSYQSLKTADHQKTKEDDKKVLLFDAIFTA
jgi:hypothetical protein